MYNKFFILIALFNIFTSCDNSNKESNKNEDIVIGKVNKLYSNILKEERKFWVYVPHNLFLNSSVDNSFFQNQKYPVIYLLDGDTHFISLVGINQQLSQANDNDLCPEAIIVGITNSDRWYDLTPTSNSVHENTGGGENFLSFIEKELIPYIDQTYPTLPNRTIIGHSLGGLMVLQALLTHNKSFDSYLAIDPSLWYDNSYLVNKTKKEISNLNLDGKSLFISLAKSFDENIDFKDLKEDTTNQTEHIRSIIEYIDNLSNSNSKLNWDYLYLENESHTTIPLTSEFYGLQFLFNYYPFDLYSFLDRNDSTLDSLISAHYKMISMKMHSEVLPKESKINSLAYTFLEENDYENALKWFNRNLKYYPKSANALDGLGDYYSKVNENKKAIDFYEKSLQIIFNPDTKKKLEELKIK